MKINFPNYVEMLKLPTTKSLYPLFEAVSNSIDAIEEGEISDGLIVITLERVPQGLLIEEGEENRELLPIQNIIVEDNGIGFIEANFSAFSELNTVVKKNRGGKGVGRVAWLKVFDFAEIQSVYSVNGNKQRGYRHFKFVCNEDAIEIIKNDYAEQNAQMRTTVYLVNCKNEYQEVMPRKRSIIAQDLVIQFLPYFMVGSMPGIVIKEDGLEEIDLWTVFESYISDKGKRERFVIANNEFNITHTKTKYHSQRNKEHRIYYAAHGRVVETHPISSDNIAHLPSKLQIDEEEYVYVGYVESNFLDQNVNQSRYTFDIPDSTEGDALFEQVDWKAIEENVNTSVGAYLGDYLEEARKDKDEKIKKYINDKAPNYSYIYTQHKDEVDKIPYRSIEKGNIGQELAKIHMQLRERFTEEAEKVLNIPDDQINSTAEYKEKLNTLLEQLNPTGKADLAEYIIHRKTILHLLQRSLKIGDDKQFQREDVIHSYDLLEKM